MKYIKQIIGKLLQDKPKSESIMKRLRRSKYRNKSTIKRKIGEIIMTFLHKTIRWKRELC
jgi:hypothetical protein